MALEHEPSLPLHSPPRYAMPRDASNPYDGFRCRIRAHIPVVPDPPQRELTMLAEDPPPGVSAWPVSEAKADHLHARKCVLSKTSHPDKTEAETRTQEASQVPRFG